MIFDHKRKRDLKIDLNLKLILKKNLEPKNCLVLESKNGDQ